MPKDIAPNVHRTITLIISGDGTICDVDRNQLPYEAVEIKEPHGRLIDREEISVDIYEDADGFHYEVSAPTVIEAEDREHE